MQTPRVFRFGIARSATFRRLSLAVPVFFPVLLAAQSTSTPNEVVKRDALEVTGFRSSLATSIEAKRHAGQVLDTITAEQVGQFGAQNIGEAIQRISGVSLTRNNGEGESISVRGLSPEFTRLEIDGRSTAITADQANPGRDSLLSVFSADLYSSIEVVKSPTAADVEGGVGGIVRLNTPNPLEIGRRTWGLQATLTDARLRDRAEPGYSVFYADVFAGGRLGLLLAATYGKRDRRIDKVQTGDPDWAQAVSTNSAVSGGWYPERLRLEGRAGELPKFNLNAKVQFKATPNLELFAHTVLTREERNENKARIQVEFSNGTLLDGRIDPATGTLVQAEFNRQRVDYNNFRRETDVDTTGVSGGAKWRGDRWSATFEAGHSDAAEDWDEYTVQARVNADGIGGYDLGGDPRTPRLYTASTALAPDRIPLRGLSLTSRIISIDESKGKLDLKRELANTGFTSIRTGVRWASTGFQRRQGNVNAALTKPTGGAITFADGLSPYVLDGSFGFGKGGSDFLTSWPTVDAKDLYQKFPSTQPSVFNNPNLFDITEDNHAAYAEINFVQDVGAAVARGNLGVRVVRTKFSGEGRAILVSAAASRTLDDEPALEGDYVEPLPAFNVTLTPDRNQNLLVRGAITRAMTRPTIDQLNPTQNINADNREISRGEPDLDPFLAWQYDLGVEFYFGRTQEGIFSVNGFNKDVQNFIVPHTIAQTLAFPNHGVPAQNYTVATFRNGGSASISGVEFNLQAPFTFLPGMLRDFGGAVNFTYTDSEFTNASGKSYTFPGASKRSYNAVLYYERSGFSGRFAYNYRDEYLIQPSSSVDGVNALYGEGSGRLDFSLRYRFKNGFRISFDALNLTEEQSYKYWDIPQRYQNFEFEGRIYSASVGYRF